METGALRDLNRRRQPSEVLSRNRAVIGGSCVRVADRDRKKLEEFFAGSWPGARNDGWSCESINAGKLGIRHWAQRLR